MTKDKEPKRKDNLHGKKDVVFRPPLKEISAPIPVRERNDDADREGAKAILNKQIADLIAKRRELRQTKQGQISERTTDSSPASGTRSKRALPKIISDIQIVPPRGTEEGTSGNSKESEGWQVVRSKGAEKKRRKNKNSSATPASRASQIKSQTPTGARPSKTGPQGTTKISP